jgi:hypothetical protein
MRPDFEQIRDARWSPDPDFSLLSRSRCVTLRMCPTLDTRIPGLLLAKPRETSNHVASPNVKKLKTIAALRLGGCGTWGLTKVDCAQDAVAVRRKQCQCPLRRNSTHSRDRPPGQLPLPPEDSPPPPPLDELDPPPEEPDPPLDEELLEDFLPDELLELAVAIFIKEDLTA